MTVSTLIAGIILAVTAAVHAALIRGRAVAPLREPGLPRIARAAFAVVWHGVTITLAAMAAAYLWLAWNDTPALLYFLSALSAGFAALFLWTGATMLGTIWRMPQWAVFLAVPALALAPF